MDKKHPIGIMPTYIWNEKRKQELSAAIIRYAKELYEIPYEWIEEYNQLILEKHTKNNNKGEKIMNIQNKVITLKEKIEQDCIECGLNLTIYDGKIGFIDQKEKKIVATWSPEYSLRIQDNNDEKE